MRILYIVKSVVIDLIVLLKMLKSPISYLKYETNETFQRRYIK